MWEMLCRLALDSLSQPHSAAKRVLALNVELPILLMAGAAASCVVVVVNFFVSNMVGQPPEAENILADVPPILFAIFQFASILISAILIHHVGRAFDGTGDFHGALTLSVWLAVLQSALQIPILAIALVVPALAVLCNLGISVWLLWVLAAFVAALHGFQSTFKVLLSILGLIFGFAVLLSIVLGAMQITMVGPGAGQG